MGDGTILGVEDDKRKLVNIGGRWMRETEITGDSDWVSKFAQGYICPQCMIDRSKIGAGAWPDPCTEPFCGMPAREQKERVEEMLEGDDKELNAQTLRRRMEKKGIYLP